MLRMDRVSRKVSIPSSNRWKYLLNFTNVLESARVNKDAVAMLNCRVTHCVHLQTLDYCENDGLYAM